MILPLEKHCSHCRLLLPIDDFAKDASRNDGHQRYCKTCSNSLRVKRDQLNPVQKHTCRMLSSARSRAKEKNLPFDIDLDYVRLIVGKDAEFASHCQIFPKIALDWSCNRGNGPRALPNSPSIDRIDPTRGYVKGNIWIVCHRANAIKSNATHEELKLLTKAVGKAIVNSLDF